MITSNDKQDYSVLFEKASAKLGLIPILKEAEDGSTTYWKRIQVNGEWSEVECAEDEVNAQGQLIIDGEVSKGISSLNEYFQHIRELASLAIGNGRSGSDPYFLRLPLDEPFLDINANTRTITVPAALRQIGVIGDKYAEIVFFKIDRYFDAIDLNTRQIYIEWEVPDGQGGVKKGVSRDFLRDVQSEKNKLIFGWVIGDELTQNIGTIRFAVRFVEWDHEAGADEDKANSNTGLAYSFSSLPAQITIVDSLHYDLFEDSKEATVIDTEGQAGTILFYLENSDPDVADETAPELAREPDFIRNLTGTATEQEGVFEHDLEGDSLELMVEATSPDSGVISYMFGRKEVLEGEGSGTTGLVAKIKFVNREDLSNLPAGTKCAYYIKKDNHTYEPIAAEDITASDVVFEKVAFMTAVEPGYYFANARNTAVGKKSTSANSNIVYIPYAAAPEINLTMPEKFVIKAVDYAVEIDENIDQSKREFADKSNLKITAGEVGPASIVLGTPLTGPTFSAAKTKGLTYTWYKADNAEMTDAEIVGSEATFEVSVPGYYAVSVDNFYNNDHKAIEKDAAGIIRVTNMPTLPEISWTKWENVIPTGAIEDIEVSEVEHDKITYEWHKVTSAADEDPIAANEMVKATDDLEFVDGVAKIPFKPLAEGDYYFILSNELNGAKIYYNSALEYGMIVVKSNGGNVNPQPPIDDGGSSDDGDSNQTQDGGEVNPENPDIINDGGNESNNG